MPTVLLNGKSMRTGCGVNEIGRGVYHKHVLKILIVSNVILCRLNLSKRLRNILTNVHVVAENSSVYKGKLTAIKSRNLGKIGSHIRDKSEKKLLVSFGGGRGNESISLALHEPYALKIGGVACRNELFKSLSYLCNKGEIKITGSIILSVDIVSIYVRGRSPGSVLDGLGA